MKKIIKGKRFDKETVGISDIALTTEQLQDATLQNCMALTAGMGSRAVVILKDAKTGRTMANTSALNCEEFAEMLASFATTYAFVNKIPSEDFIDIFCSYFEDYAKRMEI